jgi:hypothetical protein
MSKEDLFMIQIKVHSLQYDNCDRVIPEMGVQGLFIINNLLVTC